MTTIYNYNKSLDTREKYSRIDFSYWETNLVQMAGNDYIFFLNEPVSFNVGDDVMRIPLKDNKEEYKVDVVAYQPVYICTPNLFPLRNTKIADQVGLPMYTEFSLTSIFGHEDSIFVSGEEFKERGGDITIEWNTKEHNYELVIKPPLSKIRTNESFSLTVDGYTPAFVLNGRGIGYSKKTISAYTEHFGKIYNVLEIENNLVSDHTRAYNYLYKHTAFVGNANISFSVSYNNGDVIGFDNSYIPFVENSPVFPQTLSVESLVKDTMKTTSDGFTFTTLGMLNKTKTLNQVSSPFTTLREEQLNLTSNYR